jgi:phage/conjugal plasmid C-4 type zinc finger TraR family protein
MSDIIDLANDRAAELLHDALAARQRAREKTAGAAGLPSALVCEECGSDIPEPRRAAVPGVRTCIECQQVLEKGFLR